VSEEIGAIVELMPLTGLPGSLPGTPQYAVPDFPPNSHVYVRGIIMVNTDTVARTFRIHQVIRGDTPVQGNRLFPDVSMPANTKWAEGFYRGEWVIPRGSSLYMFCSSADAINIALNGEIQSL
jgi:hypothetical protein